MSEQRKTRRYDLSVPVVIRLLVGNKKRPGKGKTRDISTSGLYFTSDRHLSAGAELDMRLRLPSQVTPGSEVFISARGRVMRVEKKGDKESSHVGVAASFERYEVIRYEAARPGRNR